MTDPNQHINPDARGRLLRFIRRYCQPETCAAMSFAQFVKELGHRNKAENALRALCEEGFVQPTNYEIDPEDGALVEVPPVNITHAIRDSSLFVLTDQGYRAVDPLFVLFPDAESTESNIIEIVHPQIVTVTTFINGLLLEELKRNPDRMLSLTPREFEELVAELFAKEGFEVELTPPRKDGGRDILAVRHSDLGSHLYIAECKRYHPNRPVGVEYIRALYGVLERDRATRAILATTSHFTAGAKEFTRDLRWRIGLKDYESLKRWIIKYRTT